MIVHFTDWEDRLSLEELGEKWAAAGLEPSISSDRRCDPGDVVAVNGSPYRMTILREVGEAEAIERSRILGFNAAFPYRYIVAAD